MTKLPALIAAVVMIPSVAWTADDRLVMKKSTHSVQATLDRLTDGLKARGIGIVARIDHALVFGNPRLGTPLMQSNRTIGLDLPMKVLAWEDDGGQVWLAYVKPDVLKSEYSVTGRDDTFKEMAQALEKLTDEAVKAD